MVAIGSEDTFLAIVAAILLLLMMPLLLALHHQADIESYDPTNATIPAELNSTNTSTTATDHEVQVREIGLDTGARTRVGLVNPERGWGV